MVERYHRKKVFLVLNKSGHSVGFILAKNKFFAKEKLRLLKEKNRDFKGYNLYLPEVNRYSNK